MNPSKHKGSLGQAVVEYAMILGMIAMVGMVALEALGTNMQNALRQYSVGGAANSRAPGGNNRLQGETMGTRANPNTYNL